MKNPKNKRTPCGTAEGVTMHVEKFYGNMTEQQIKYLAKNCDELE